MPKCSENTKNKIIVLTDKGSYGKMTFNNPSQKNITKIRVDGCLIKDGRKCDYLVINHDQTEHFVELKGTKIYDACEQIELTIKALSKSIHKKLKYSFIVSSACPLITTDVQKLKIHFKKNYNCILTVKNIDCKHNL